MLYNVAPQLCLLVKNQLSYPGRPSLYIDLHELSTTGAELMITCFRQIGHIEITYI